MRRSLVAGGLPRDQCERLIDTCSRLLAERVQMERMLKELGPAWRGARRTLNELYRVLKPPR